MPASETLLPAPFDWIEIPDKGYSIAKYPVTNAQYARFIEASGYNTKKWWLSAGWQAKATLQLDVPAKWHDEQFNSDEQPVIVIWHEALAFCNWLSALSAEKITLPTEDQWQYAAQGDDGRLYPWGDRWNSAYCHTSVGSRKRNRTCPVTTYEGKGDSPFGVVDMVGNVDEWCLTDFETGSNDLKSDAKFRSLRGGNWKSSGSIHQDAPNDMRKKLKENPAAFYPGCTSRSCLMPDKAYAPLIGFRMVRISNPKQAYAKLIRKKHWWSLFG